ncbi:RHS repeat-associated core domain-containing protein [Treponema pedis]|uniref:YD repeat-containing protein n=1 Tax=Treponema pedis TaxID=409322 RepID=A0A7S7AXI1_9SPIR|nr:RHS repeat-associated core domain-containing protein [Treponema pedis]QOW61641.1 hypothetical protein IFE08_04495 [Treponema pedis]
MKISYLFNQPNYLTSRTAIAREQKQFIKIAFAVHLSAVISAERYRSDSGALKSAVFNFIFFIMLKNKIEQSAKRKLLLNKNNLSEVFPLTKGSGKTMAFENRHVGCKEREKINRRRIFDTLRINFFEATPQTACIFSKENYRYDANGYITAEKDGPFSEEEEFIFTYNYDKESGVYSTDYGFGLDAPKETEQTNPQDLFSYRRNYTWTYKSKTAKLFLTTYNNFLTQQARKGLNEKNLLTKSSDKNYTVHYRYGEDGKRALKYTEEGRSETLYFNNFFTIHIPIYDKDNPQGLRVHKHIFVGNSRLVTAMTHTDNHGDNDEQKEKRYYYHSDHLGSAQFVTDWHGKQYEHIEYTPYGELWVEETAPGIDKLPFRFTGKELDEETGLYYYGARYLDPKYSRWLSGDPALNDYIPKAPIDDEAKKHNENLPGMGGIYNTVNLHVYHYAGNNPVKYIDPDGKVLKISGSISYRKQVMSILKKLDPNVKINLITGSVTTTSTSDSAGAQLIRRLQVSKNTVTIMNDGSISTAPKSREKAETPGIGSDSIVYFSINVKLSNDYFIRDENGNIEKAKHTPAEIALGHELIHGLHYAEGTGDNSTSDYTYTTAGFQDGKYKSGDVLFQGGLLYDKYPREEARTIGVGEFSNDPITENALRRQLKYHERLTH